MCIASYLIIVSSILSRWLLIFSILFLVQLRIIKIGSSYQSTPSSASRLIHHLVHCLLVYIASILINCTFYSQFKSFLQAITNPFNVVVVVVLLPMSTRITSAVAPLLASLFSLRELQPILPIQRYYDCLLHGTTTVSMTITSLSVVFLLDK